MINTKTYDKFALLERFLFAFLVRNPYLIGKEIPSVITKVLLFKNTEELNVLTHSFNSHTMCYSHGSSVFWSGIFGKRFNPSSIGEIIPF